MLRQTIKSFHPQRCFFEASLSSSASRAVICLLQRSWLKLLSGTFSTTTAQAWSGWAIVSSSAL